MQSNTTPALSSQLGFGNCLPRFRFRSHYWFLISTPVSNPGWDFPASYIFSLGERVQLTTSLFLTQQELCSIRWPVIAFASPLGHLHEGAKNNRKFLVTWGHHSQGGKHTPLGEEMGCLISTPHYFSPTWAFKKWAILCCLKSRC